MAGPRPSRICPDFGPSPGAFGSLEVTSTHVAMPILSAIPGSTRFANTQPVFGVLDTELQGVRSWRLQQLSMVAIAMEYLLNYRLLSFMTWANNRACSRLCPRSTPALFISLVSPGSAVGALGTCAVRRRGPRLGTST